ncbi:protein translocase subunit SecD [SCandidatus Aminicenantes bacterium Aminicenantia_JdfR_composite]|jgi:preprotein translocase subunit SecD|nr:protein translocase subunit SecD [SCandidatus Aminicenantes bacterium Aminicenantia_JdfR_composite]MCP2597635.1 protein translocase subunit SecD [Candidatus Aminicenantes bacterium AC-335-G13]
MRRRIGWRLGLTLFIIGLSIFLAYPPKEKIKLGLDLKGGIHLVLQVMTDDAINIETDQEIARLQEEFKKERLEFSSIKKEKIGEIVIEGIKSEQEGKIRDILDDLFREWNYSIRGDKVFLTMKARVASYLRDQAVKQAIETIRNRVDQFGVAEPVIQRQGMGGDRILVQLPGVEDPERVKKIIKTTALLELKLVEAGPAPDIETLLKDYGGKVPDQMEIVKGDPTRTEGGYYLVHKVAVITGKDLKNARRSVDEWNNPDVVFTLTPSGAKRFEKATSENVGRLLAIILDGKVQSSPVIRERIASDSASIQGRFTVEQAEDLALILRAGALPASIKYLEERTIGPSLGADSIRKGLTATIIALILVMAFMVFYYKLSGINSVVALILNMVILAGALAYFRATLTLPGIAGIILTIGMSVDANVLIFERIREDLRLGKTVRAAIASGFSKAFRTILDANVTTIIAAIFLFQFGTGPVKGFAVTLIIGISASMFTAVFVSRLIFDIVLSRKKKIEKLSI